MAGGFVAYSSIRRLNSFCEEAPLMNFEQNMELFNSYLMEDQEVFDLNGTNKEEEDEHIEVNPMFNIMRQRSLINDADDHVTHIQDEILKELQKTQNQMDEWLLSDRSAEKPQSKQDMADSELAREEEEAQDFIEAEALRHNAALPPYVPLGARYAASNVRTAATSKLGAQDTSAFTAGAPGANASARIPVQDNAKNAYNSSLKNTQ